MRPSPLRSPIVDALADVLVLQLQTEMRANAAAYAGHGFAALLLPIVRAHVCSKWWYFKLWCFALMLGLSALVLLSATGMPAAQALAQAGGLTLAILMVLVPACWLLRAIAKHRFRAVHLRARILVEQERVTTAEWDAAMTRALRNPWLPDALPLFEGLRTRCVESGPLNQT